MHKNHDWIKLRGKDFDILAVAALRWGLYGDRETINKIVGSYLSAKVIDNVGTTSN
jgi:hypothetical protein